MIFFDCGDFSSPFASKSFWQFLSTELDPSWRSKRTAENIFQCYEALQMRWRSKEGKRWTREGNCQKRAPQLVSSSFLENGSLSLNQFSDSKSIDEVHLSNKKPEAFEEAPDPFDNATTRKRKRISKVFHNSITALNPGGKTAKNGRPWFGIGGSRSRLAPSTHLSQFSM